MKKKRSSAKIDAVLTITLVILALIAVGLGIYLYTLNGGSFSLPSLPSARPSSTRQTEATPKPTPTPTALKPGKDTYTISQSSSVPGPKITSLTLDPLDPKKGQQQTLSVAVSFGSPVDEVTISVKSDSTSRTLPALTLASGTSTAGTWQGSWTVDDTVLYAYVITITATGAGTKSTVQVAPRM